MAQSVVIGNNPPIDQASSQTRAKTTGKKAPGAKKTLPIRNEFTGCRNSNNDLAVKCNKCKSIMTRQPKTMYNHFDKCSKLNDKEKTDLQSKYTNTGYYSDQHMKQLQQQQSGQVNVSLETIVNNINNNCNPQTQLESKLETNAKLCDKYGTILLKPDHHKLLQQELCNWTISKNIPPNAFDDPHWKLYTKLMRPDFETPGSDRLLGDLLDNREKETSNIMKKVRFCKFLYIISFSVFLLYIIHS